MAEGGIFSYIFVLFLGRHFAEGVNVGTAGVEIPPFLEFNGHSLKYFNHIFGNGRSRGQSGRINSGTVNEIFDPP